jgi:polyphosphate kinase
MASKDFTFDRLLVAQFNLRERFLEMIDREIEHQQAGRGRSYIGEAKWS